MTLEDIPATARFRMRLSKFPQGHHLPVNFPFEKRHTVIFLLPRPHFYSRNPIHSICLKKTPLISSKMTPSTIRFWGMELSHIRGGWNRLTNMVKMPLMSINLCKARLRHSPCTINMGGTGETHKFRTFHALISWIMTVKLCCICFY